MTVQKLSTKMVRLKLDDIRPYWRNPRKISEDAIASVARSIAEFGYNQPIVVDSEYVIVIGHTRYAALRQLGEDEIDVQVVSHLTPDQITELRVVDNRTSEYSTWDYGQLSDELVDLDSALLNAMFPEVILTEDPDAEQSFTVTAASTETTFICPSCFHEWAQKIDRDEVMAGRITT